MSKIEKRTKNIIFMINFIWGLIKWSFRFGIVIIIIRIFFSDSPVYQNYLKNIFEPIFQMAFNKFATLEDHKSNENQQKQQQKEELEEQQNEENQGNSNQKNKKNVIRKDKNNQNSNQQNIAKNCENLSNAKYNQSWKDLQQSHNYLAKIAVNAQTACKSNSFRENLTINYTGDDETYYSELYGKLVKFCSPKMVNIFKTFEIIQKNKKLNQEEFAEMVVTFIQSIPYTLILDKSAKDAINQGGFAADYIKEKKPYVENIKFGLQSPIEFLYNKKGDCDTRTVLAYTILKRFGYDVAILNCKTHSMLGLNIPAHGTSLNMRGKKYYFWETTAFGWQLGQMTDQFKHEKNWAVVLASKND